MISILIPSGILLAVYWARVILDRVKSGKKIPWIVPLAFTCLFIPKINIFNINRMYSTAGIRMDDLLTVVLLVMALREGFTYKNKYIKWGLGFLAALTAASLVSMMTGIQNGLENDVPFSILSIIRKYEYFAFALVGTYMARKTENAEKTVLREFLWANGLHVIIALLQVFGVCNYAVSGSVTENPWKWNVAVSTFNGYYEYGQFLCFGVAVWMCVFLRTRKIRYLLLAAASCGMIVLTRSRTSLMLGLMLMLLILLFSIRKKSSRFVKIGTAVVVAAVMIAGALFLTGVVKLDRFSGVNLNEYAENLRSNIENGDLQQYAENIRNNTPEEEAIQQWIPDGSASIRFYKWGAAIDGFRQFPLFGYGTGVTHVIDGNYVKLLGETGLIGLLLYLGMFICFMRAVWVVRKQVPAAKSVFWMMVSILIGALFIDMFEASKPMEMLWLAFGLVIGLAPEYAAEAAPVKVRINRKKVLSAAVPAAAFAAAVLAIYWVYKFRTVKILPVSLAVLGVYWAWYLIAKRKKMPLVVPILFTCFFLPKLNLVKVSGLSTAGIRIDDFLALLLLAVAVLKDSATWKNRYIKRGIEILIILSAVNLLSLASGLVQGYGNQILLSVLMIIRKFEYFAFALVGVYAVRHRKMKDPYRVFMNEFTVMSLLHIGLSVLQILGKTTYMVSGEDAAYFFEGIAVSTFNGYYEYGQFLCFGCAIFLCDFLKNKNKVSFLMLPLTLGMLVLSKSRSSLIVGALLMVLIFYLPVRNKVSRTKLLFGGLGLIAALAAGLMLMTGILELNAFGRFGTVKLDELAENWGLFSRRGDFPQYVSLLRDGVAEMDAIDELHYLDKITDWSAAVRFLKWFAAMDGFRLNPVLGYGTGVTHVMDGNYIKLLGETGLAGTALWLVFYGYFMHAVYKARRASKLAKALLFIMVSILLNSLLLDMFEASKPMEMMWLMVGGAVVFARGSHAAVPAAQPEITAGKVCYETGN